MVKKRNLCTKNYHVDKIYLQGSITPTKRCNTEKTSIWFIKVCSKISLHNLGCNHCACVLVYVHFHQKLFAKKASTIFKERDGHKMLVKLSHRESEWVSERKTEAKTLRLKQLPSLTKTDWNELGRMAVHLTSHYRSCLICYDFLCRISMLYHSSSRSQFYKRNSYYERLN